MNKYISICPTLSERECRAICFLLDLGYSDEEEVRRWLSDQLQNAIKRAVGIYNRSVMRVQINTGVEITPQERTAIAKLLNEGQFDLDPTPASEAECAKYLTENLQAAIEIAVDMASDEDICIRGRCLAPNQKRLPLTFEKKAVPKGRWSLTGRTKVAHFFENKLSLCGVKTGKMIEPPNDQFRCVNCSKALQRRKESAEIEKAWSDAK